MKRLLLVNPYFNRWVTVPSLGLGFIATYVQNNTSCSVEVVEPVLQGLKREAVIDKVKNADFLGLVCYSESRFACFEFAQKAKEINPSCIVVVGGSHMLDLDEQVLLHYNFIDCVVRGEGEEAMLEIIKGGSFDRIKGITFRDNGRLVRNPDRDLSAQIEKFELDYSFYLPWLRQWKDIEVPDYLKGMIHIPIIASRGCPFRCSFCAAHRQWAGKWRVVAPEVLVDRLKFLVEHYRAEYFRFYDSLFTCDSGWVLRLCELLEKENLPVHFRIDIRAGMPRQILERLRMVGCDIVGFGIESGSDKVLSYIQKKTNSRLIEETIQVCRDLGFWIIGFFMISLPKETMRDYRQTLRLFNLFDVLNLQFFKIFPGTSSYEELRIKNRIDDGKWFDHKYGFNIEGGYQVFYCKELFPEAYFYYEEAIRLRAYSLELTEAGKKRKPQDKFVIRMDSLLRSFLLRLLTSNFLLLRITVMFKERYLIRQLRQFLRFLLSIIEGNTRSQRAEETK
jgi:radical SAM superfamily enzyme YgiQ (UPF0313 family)